MARTALNIRRKNQEKIFNIFISLRLMKRLPRTMPPFQVRMRFGDTEITATAVDMATGQEVDLAIDFLTDSNVRYCTKL